jgi:UDP-glucose 4-epimerase
MKKILITGGLGFIGAHTALAFLEAGMNVILLDNLSNSDETMLDNMVTICGKKIVFIKGNVLDYALLTQIFKTNEINAVIHFAGLKSVNESITSPLLYFENNVSGTLVLLKAMQEANIYNFVFSSSATVYGAQNIMPIREDCVLNAPHNTYGRTKLMIEQVLRDLIASDSRWHVAILRYFNPVGAHKSGLIGENPVGIPNNLLPYLCCVAQAELLFLNLFGNDYDTIDGTGVRDYVHVLDLAEGHICALRAIKDQHGINIWNLGTGIGYSVLEIICAFEAVSNRKIKYQIAPRRPGDLSVCYADASKAESELGWKAKFNLHEMMIDTWYPYTKKNLLK